MTDPIVSNTSTTSYISSASSGKKAEAGSTTATHVQAGNLNALDEQVADAVRAFLGASEDGADGGLDAPLSNLTDEQQMLVLTKWSAIITRSFMRNMEVQVAAAERDNKARLEDSLKAHDKMIKAMAEARRKAKTGRILGWVTKVLTVVVTAIVLAAAIAAASAATAATAGAAAPAIVLALLAFMACAGSMVDLAGQAYSEDTGKAPFSMGSLLGSTAMGERAGNIVGGLLSANLGAAAGAAAEGLDTEWVIVITVAATLLQIALMAKLSTSATGGLKVGDQAAKTANTADDAASVAEKAAKSAQRVKDYKMAAKVAGYVQSIVGGGLAVGTSVNRSEIAHINFDAKEQQALMQELQAFMTKVQQIIMNTLAWGREVNSGMHKSMNQTSEIISEWGGAMSSMAQGGGGSGAMA